jgi:tetratricopeptide (TPR) repeat protein
LAHADHYKTLGVAADAEQDAIKKRYRELARKYHPDMNPSPEAAATFKKISEAYQVIGDADRRAVYDAERALRQNNTPPARPAGAPPRRAERPGSPASPRPAPNRNVDYNGFGTVRPPRPASPQRPTPANSSPQPQPQQQRPTQTANRSTSTFGTVERLIAEAQLAYINRRYREAEDLCGQILMIDRRSAVAHEILGDIYVKRGRMESAITAYSYAAQFNPRNMSVQTKLERLSGAQSRPSPTVTHKPESGWSEYAGDHQETLLMVMSGVLLLLVGVMCALLYYYPGSPIGLPIVGDWSFSLVAALGLNGIFSGVLLAINGGMRPLMEELFSRTPEQEERRLPVTLGGLLLMFSVVWFYAGLLIYIGIGFARNRFSPSVLRAFGLTLFLMMLHAALDQRAWISTLLASGNILFPAVIFGWAVGDAFRLRSRN